MYSVLTNTHLAQVDMIDQERYLNSKYAIP